MMENWSAKHSIISGNRMSFDGTGLQFLGKFILLFILTVITCGLYLPWAVCSYNQWITKHTHVDKHWVS